jgi:hypothetical protein
MRSVIKKTSENFCKPYQLVKFHYLALSTIFYICQKNRLAFPSVFSLIYQLMKHYKPSEINSIMMTHWWNGLPCNSNPQWNCWRFVWEPHIFRWEISSASRKIARLWEAFYHLLLATSLQSILRYWVLTRHSINHHCSSVTLVAHLWSGLMAQASYTISTATTSQ